MEEKLKQIETLLGMFDARDAMWSKHNRQIAKVITPTAIEALNDLFDLPPENIELVDMQVMETILLIVCNITYDPATTTSMFLQRVDDARRPDTPIQVQRYLRIGIPLAIVFSPKEEILEFLLSVPVESTDSEEDVQEIFTSEIDEDRPEATKAVSQVLGFDTSGLTDDQIKTMMLYHHTLESTKQ